MSKLKTFRVGSIEVKIYPASNQRAVSVFYDFNGDRIRIERKSKFQAEADARELIARMTSTDFLESQSAEKILEPFGVSVIEAARYYAKQHSFHGSKKTVGDIWEEMYESLCKRFKVGELSKAYVNDLRFRIGGFSNQFKDKLISHLSRQEITNFIETSFNSSRSKKNHRASIVALFRFAQEKGYLSEAKTIADEIKIKKEGLVLIEFFTPEEMLSLLKSNVHQEKDIRLFLLLGGFAGLRTEEIKRPTQYVNNRVIRDAIRWEDILWNEKQLFVRPEVAKVQEGRYVPLSDNLLSWLEQYKGQQGRVWERGSLKKVYKLLCLSTGIRWKHNGLRHAYGTYRTAIVKSVPQVAFEMGNSPQMVKRHYQRPIPDSVARAWWEILPRV